jgi:hypothetical protein
MKFYELNDFIKMDFWFDNARWDEKKCGMMIAENRKWSTGQRKRV